MKFRISACAIFALAVLGLAANALAAGRTMPGFAAPTGIVAAGDGSLYVSEWGAGQVARIRNGQKEIVLRGLPSPAGLALDPRGNLYIAGYGDGNIYVWDGRGEAKLAASGLAAPTGLLWDGDTLLAASRNAGEIVRIGRDGKKETVSSGHSLPVGIARTGDGRLVVSCYGGSVEAIDAGGRVDIGGSLATPGAGITAAGRDAVFVADYGAGNIARIDGSGVTEVVARGLKSPVALALLPDGGLVAGCWGDGALHFIDTHNQE